LNSWGTFAGREEKTGGRKKKNRDHGKFNFRSSVSKKKKRTKNAVSSLGSSANQYHNLRRQKDVGWGRGVRGQEIGISGLGNVGESLRGDIRSYPRVWITLRVKCHKINVTSYG